MRQTLAIFIDAYRELNAKKMFWIVLILSGLVVAVFAAIGIDQNGLKFLVWTVPGTEEVGQMFKPDTFYKLMFTNLGIQFWLTWIATILALISTASMFPDFISGGSIELVLSKPIGRWRLFLTKYAAGLLFVTLQVAIFCVASFLLVGLRGKAWEFGIFLAIPIVVLFFSYLYSICTLLGIVTRSTLAALLLTMLIWCFFWALNTTDNILMQTKHDRIVSVERMEEEVGEFQTTIEQLQGQIEDGIDDYGEPLTDEEQQRLEQRLSRQQEDLEETQEDLTSQRRSKAALQKWHRRIFVAKTIFPKTGETTELLDRYLISKSEFEKMLEGMQGSGNGQDAEVTRRVAAEINSRSIWWVIGTSAGFEAFVLLLAGLIFARRDF